ncbi:MAG TPA: lipase family protein, partial [Nitrolancea sp.]|nr:lipase family protein [Nitrolancea sp.]
KSAAAPAAPSDRRGGYRRGLRVLRASVSLLLALTLVGLSAFLHRGSPAVSAFYDAPSTLPSTPGQLVRSDPFERGLPANARAVRILYTTTALDGSIGVASGLVIIPTTPARGDWPVLLWEHGTTGIARQCAPSLLDDPLGAGAMPAQQQAIDHGWVIVAPDYIGLGTKGPHPYLIGIPVATSSLDAVRAARQIDGLTLSDKTVVWGHSQGGGAALWVGIEAKRYAPDVPLLGVAALAPASDLPAFTGEVEQNPVMQLFASYIIDAYSRVYPDVRLDDYIRPTARTVVRSMAARCLSEPAMLLSLGAILPGESMISRNPTDGALGIRLRENVPDQPSGVPTFLGQGLTDSLIEPETQARFVAGLCGQGQVVEYHTYANRDHLGVVADDSPLIPDLLAWTEARFAGQPSASVCSTTKE